MSEPLARALHTEAKVVLEVFSDDRGGLKAVPAPADAGATFISNLSAAAIDPELAGTWLHFKGGLYEFVTRVASQKGELVLYRDESGGSWLRPLAMVSEPVERDGRRCPRFTRLTRS